MSANSIAPVGNSTSQAQSTNHTQKTDVAGVVAQASAQEKAKKSDVAGILAFGAAHTAPEGTRDLAIG